jgi:hypothetical protein
MSIEAITWAFGLPSSISPVAKSVAVALADCHNGKTDLCCPGTRMIERKTNWTRPTILKALDELEAIGAIRIKKGDRRHPNHYTLFGVVNHATSENHSRQKGEGRKASDYLCGQPRYLCG